MAQEQELGLLEKAKEWLDLKGKLTEWWYTLEWADVLWLLAIPALFLIWRLVKNLLKAIEEEAEKRLVAQVPGAMDKAVIAIGRFFTFGFKGKYCQRLINVYRDYRIQGLKTRGPFVLDLEKVFVPLQVVPESPQQIPPDMLKSGKVGDAGSIWEYLAIPEQPAFRRLAVIGAPGSGKTTLLQHLTLVYAKRAQRNYHPKAPKLVPVLLYLRDLRERIVAEPELDLATLIQKCPELQGLPHVTHQFNTYLARGVCLVMLDGLDEVADATQRQAVGRWADRQMQVYSRARFILTSRPFGYLNAPLEKIGTVLAVQPFTLRQMSTFLDHWYLQNEIMRRQGRDDPGVRQQAAQKAKDLKNRITGHPALATMAINPLLLTMIATVHDNRGALPGRRVELYAEICDVLLGRRQEAKGLVDTLSAAQKKRVLQALALALMERKTREFDPAWALN